MHRPLIALFAASIIATPAYAHGAEIVVSFYAQAIAMVAVLVVLRFVPKFRPHWVAGSVGCVGGVLVSWLAVANVPYLEHQLVITISGVVIPITLAALSVYVVRRYATEYPRA